MGRIRIGLVGLLAIGAVAVACGDDDDDAAPEASADAAVDDGAGPVTVEHLYGETTLEQRPARIVSLDTQWTDVLTALDAPLVGAAVFEEGSGEPYPWQQLADGVEPIPVNVTDGIPYEVIAGLDPDLVVITYGAVEETDYEQLSEIAPTIPLLGDAQVDPWEDIAAQAGEILGMPEEAARLVSEAEERNAEVATELPGLAGRTFAFANYVPGDALYVLTDPDDGANRFFSQLGLAIEPDLLAEADAGRLELSLENVDRLDAELLLLLTNGAEPAEIPGYDQLPAVQDGAVAVVDMATAVALNTPTPLSLPYALDQIRPALEAAAG
jgi:iron complex transport system substrate-binding protein